MDKFSQRWRRLCSITHRQGVRLFLNHEVPGFRSSDWDGLWLRDPEEGSAIALSPSLDRSNILWVFAHELGHEFSVSQGTLVSPFWEAHISTKKSQKRWARGKTLNKGEIAANLQGAKLLVTESEWLEAESAHPTCLRAIADHLELPAVAALWRARVNEPEPLTAQIPLGTDALTQLEKPVVGRGGPQSLLRRLQSDLNQRVLTCSRKDFLRCREYALNLGGFPSPHHRGVIAGFFGRWFSRSDPPLFPSPHHRGVIAGSSLGVEPPPLPSLVSIPSSSGRDRRP